MDEQYIAKLVKDFHKDFLYNCHSVEKSYNQSDAKKELVKVGTQSFPNLANLIKSTFVDMKTAHKSEVDWDLFAYIVWLLGEIIDTHNLPERQYSCTTRFGEQDMEKWYAYCLTYQT